MLAQVVTRLSGKALPIRDLYRNPLMKSPYDVTVHHLYTQGLHRIPPPSPPPALLASLKGTLCAGGGVGGGGDGALSCKALPLRHLYRDLLLRNAPPHRPTFVLSPIRGSRTGFSQGYLERPYKDPCKELIRDSSYTRRPIGSTLRAPMESPSGCAGRVRKECALRSAQPP